MPAALARARADEAAYAEMTVRVSAHLDPLPHDAFPNHIWCWGANLAVRATMLAAVGGSPAVALAEDRALHAVLLRHGARIRDSEAVRVLTSARSDGRAPGGFADLMAQYSEDRAALADFWLEPAALTWARAAQRGAARRAWLETASGQAGSFGAYWADHEARSPALAPQRVSLAGLPAETDGLALMLRYAADRSGIAADAAATPASHREPVPQ